MTQKHHHWILFYFAITLECDTPIIEVLHHCLTTPLNSIDIWRKILTDKSIKWPCTRKLDKQSFFDNLQVTFSKTNWWLISFPAPKITLRLSRWDMVENLITFDWQSSDLYITEQRSDWLLSYTVRFEEDTKFKVARIHLSVDNQPLFDSMYAWRKPTNPFLLLLCLSLALEKTTANLNSRAVNQTTETKPGSMEFYSIFMDFCKELDCKCYLFDDSDSE